MPQYKIVHYINQFFANIGGEEKADIAPEKRDGVVGPGAGLQGELKKVGVDAEIVATVICGDSYFNENLEKAKKEVLDMIKSYSPDLVIAGPAFNAGRYGTACGTVAKMVQDELKIPAVTGMYVENPGADMFKKDVYIVSTKDSAAGMRNALPVVAKLAAKLLKKEEIGAPEAEGYIPRGIRKVLFRDKVGAERAVDMLIQKLKGEAFTTEYPMPDFDRVTPGEAIKDITKAKIAIVTSGGIVPSGNPDHIESSSASKYGRYSIDDMGETAHGGYDPTYANQDPNRVLPVDVLKEIQKEGKIGELYPYYYTTVGNGTSVKNSKAFATEFAQTLVKDGVQAVILTSTWGTCTRCGATMVKEIERAGIPVVHMATVVPISLTIGANRIIPGVGIPYPLGNPPLGEEASKKIRRKMVERALKALQTEVTEQTVFEE